MSTVVLSHALYDPGMRLLEQNGIDVVIPNNGNSDDILEDLQKADGFILRIGKIDRKAIEACPDLKVITRPGVGVDNVDVQAATEHGIPVVICPAANSRSVAEHTIALMFAASKNLIESDRETRKGNFGIRNKYAAVELKDKTLAVLGFGHIGREVASMAAALGMKVVAYDPFLDKQKVESMGYGHAGSLEEAVSAGDFVTLHMPSLPETKGMINKSVFSQAKETAYFINCARGDIVNEQDLYDALASGSIAGAAVDVLSLEPMEASSPLMRLDNFIVTPHMAGQTREATTTIVTMAVEGTLAVLKGEKWPHVCNPEVYGRQAWKDRQ
ncbi:hydroxyacid dehydrogenase [Sediminispirochaeta smaragdinae]|uniref:D-isomer specific 2-hydroxyacid dehydrogenase NAD-binding protein n=1 Tax=Sediminispirochaeta smaragdinae (strain DSM 11293 / JCM 15392 / SEBR 4228) TaxID=573413 RepID=E1R634_SEDSS|nr:hydroxyacid dehydrogenase [Sediminispirochaeta smaragdinae]ADK80799.1 D-isomer specific 2-hydroxyacid dehydrogenase NAD-binding protein [Sediminispirochaeta smaragdinae DSM 11293]